MSDLVTNPEDQFSLVVTHIYYTISRTLLDKVTTLLKYPNSARVDKILPPLHVTNKIVKTEKLKQERKSLIAQQSARDKKQAPISVS